jgi:hypothetical protein
MNYGIFGSSEDPTKLGDTVKGMLIAIAPLVILLARNWGVDVAQSEYVEFAGIFGTIVGSIWAAFGLAKKVFVKAYGAYGNR